MPDLGYGLLLACFVVATYTFCAAVIGHLRGSQRLIASARYGVYSVLGLLTCASLALIYLFVIGDYSVKYVQHYSDRSMPMFYKVTALWGGQDGSLLFWVWVMSIWSAIAVYQNRDRNKELMPFTIATMMWVTLFFVTLLVFVCNPFQTFLGAAPSDGRGLNPLLQNPYMVTHPPTLYLGYIGWTIPFCFAMGALLHGKLDYGWIASMRRWCLVAWVMLSVGLTLGGLWAYEELGWGGYWAWDPVENAAFMPFLTGTAFIHSIQVQERRGIFRAWNLTLIIITFILTLLGTMMTRSGIVESVHAFAQSDIGEYFLGFLFVTVCISFGMVIYRSKELRGDTGLESILSREFAFLINNWVLLAAAFFVTFATVFPSIYKFFWKQEINVGPAFFNLWMVPIGLALLFLCGVGPLLSWRKSTYQTLWHQFTMPSSAGIVGALLGHFAIPRFFQQPASIKATIAFGTCVFVSATILQEYWRGTRQRQRNTGEGFLDALITLITRARRRYGGYLVHFGAVMMFFGFAGNAFNIEEQATLTKGEKKAVGKYEVRLDALVFEDDGQKNMATAQVTVLDGKSGAELGTLRPAKWAYRKPEEQVTTEVDKRMTLAGDLYLVLGGYDSERGAAVLQLRVIPLVNFVWMGCSFLMFGFCVSIWPERRRVRVPVLSHRTVAVAAGAASFLLGIFSTALAFL